MDLSYMMAGYLIIWMLAFGFILSMWQKSRRLERDLEAVRSLVEQLDRE